VFVLVNQNVDIFFNFVDLGTANLQLLVLSFINFKDFLLFLKVRNALSGSAELIGMDFPQCFVGI
jgi:hypothetical protein